MEDKITRPQVEALVAESDRAAMRAVCALFRQQTLDEKMAEATRHDNMRGFSQAHAKVGSELAHWMTGGRDDGVFRRRVGGRFAPRWLFGGKRPNGSKIWSKGNQSAFAGRSRIAVCREIALHYAGQLTRIANGEL